MFRYAEAGGSSAVIAVFTGVDELARCSPVSDESKRVSNDVKCAGVVAADVQYRADCKPGVTLLPTEEESIPGRLLLPSECEGEDSRE